MHCSIGFHIDNKVLIIRFGELKIYRMGGVVNEKYSNYLTAEKNIAGYM